MADADHTTSPSRKIIAFPDVGQRRRLNAPAADERLLKAVIEWMDTTSRPFVELLRGTMRLGDRRSIEAALHDIGTFHAGARPESYKTFRQILWSADYLMGTRERLAEDTAVGPAKILKF